MSSKKDSTLWAVTVPFIWAVYNHMLEHFRFIILTISLTLHEHRPCLACTSLICMPIFMRPRADFSGRSSRYTPWDRGWVNWRLATGGPWSWGAALSGTDWGWRCWRSKDWWMRTTSTHSWRKRRSTTSASNCSVRTMNWSTKMRRGRRLKKKNDEEYHLWDERILILAQQQCPRVSHTGSSVSERSVWLRSSYNKREDATDMAVLKICPTKFPHVSRVYPLWRSGNTGQTRKYLTIFCVLYSWNKRMRTYKIVFLVWFFFQSSIKCFLLWWIFASWISRKKWIAWSRNNETNE